MPIISLTGRILVEDHYGNYQVPLLDIPILARWTSTVFKREQVVVAAGTFQALSPPSGATWFHLDPSSAVSLILKGITGDTGVAVIPATNPIQVPLMVTLGATPSIGILNDSADPATLTITWL